MSIKNIAVFCGSSLGKNELYAKAAFELGQFMAAHSYTLVYGGAQVGLMGKLADGALSQQGKIIGVLPHFLDTKEIAHPNLNELIQVESMHERKMKMHELSDAVIALPGGYGTLDELFEMLTWGQLGVHEKPMALWNVNGYFDHLNNFARKMRDEGFLKPIHYDMLIIEENLESLFNSLRNYQAPEAPKWIKKREQT